MAARGPKALAVKRRDTTRGASGSGGHQPGRAWVHGAAGRQPRGPPCAPEQAVTFTEPVADVLPPSGQGVQGRLRSAVNVVLVYVPRGQRWHPTPPKPGRQAARGRFWVWGGGGGSQGRKGLGLRQVGPDVAAGGALRCNRAPARCYACAGWVDALLACVCVCVCVCARARVRVRVRVCVHT